MEECTKDEVHPTAVSSYDQTSNGANYYCTYSVLLMTCFAVRLLIMCLTIVDDTIHCYHTFSSLPIACLTVTYHNLESLARVVSTVAYLQPHLPASELRRGLRNSGEKPAARAETMNNNAIRLPSTKDNIITVIIIVLQGFNLCFSLSRGSIKTSDDSLLIVRLSSI